MENKVDMSTKFARLFTKSNRFGLHYFSDTLHYRESDLYQWLPELSSLKISYLVLKTLANRAVPEYFIEALVKEDIQPILHLDIPLSEDFTISQLDPIFHAYAKWGVHSIIFYDRPNSRDSWDSSHWILSDWVTSFFNKFVPLANLALDHGIFPALPPLEPGGHFWDTAFLRCLLESLVRDNQTKLCENLVLSAYAWDYKRSLNWGAGGSAYWQNSKPFFTPLDGEDQKGFRAHEWHQEVTQSILGNSHPIILLGAGLSQDPAIVKNPETNSPNQEDICLAIGRLLNRELICDLINPQNLLLPVSEDIFACNFWSLSAEPGSDNAGFAWYENTGQPNPIVNKWKEFCVSAFGKIPESSVNSSVNTNGNENKNSPPFEITNQILTNDKNSVFAGINDYSDKDHQQAPLPSGIDSSETNTNSTQEQPPVNTEKVDRTAKSASVLARPIKHYLLLPAFEWGITDWHLEVIKPFVKKYRPTIGFSLKEAVLAEHITIIGGTQIFPDDLVERFRLAGCEVDRIEGDGMTIATILTER
jgi:hypothetical protein